MQFNLTWINKRVLSILLWTITLLYLSGCATGTHSIIPEEGLTMDQIYYQTTSDGDKETAASGEEAIDAKTLPAKSEQNVTLQYTGYTRTAQNEIDSQFKALPNPSIPIYIYPHLTRLGDEMLPIPGYTTTFFLYRHNQYAMNTEVY